MSAGQLFDLIMPAAFVISALLSTWVLASARRRFQLHYAIAFAAGTLFLTLIVFPLYLAKMLWRKKSEPPTKWRYALPIVYAVITLSAIGVFFYLDTRSVDAHLARATQAKLVEDTNRAIREYRKALALEDNPHTRKLLAIELANAGNLTEAISEFQLARQGGEPDDVISFRLGVLLERVNLTNQAKLEFESFLRSDFCRSEDPLCEVAKTKLPQMNQR